MDTNYNGQVLDGKDFTNKDLSGSSFHGASLKGAILSGANLAGCNLYKADLTGAVLIRTCFRHAFCEGMILTDAVIRETDFGWSNMTGCDLRGIDLRLASDCYPYSGDPILDRTTLLPEKWEKYKRSQ